MINRILINREECEVRVAFMDTQALVELHTEKFDDHTIVNNIYRGRVQDVIPGLQAAFIDVGLERNMFLHFMDIRPESLVMGDDDQEEALRRASEEKVPGRIERRGRRPRQDPHAPQGAPPVRKGDEIIVQVVKDEIGGKAPRVTTNLSLAGRYLVMLPFPSQEGGVSRKIAVGQDRYRLKKMLSDLNTEDHSFIVRTAGVDQPEESLNKDAEALAHLWHTILAKYKQLNGPGLVHNDHDLLARLVRDAFPAEFEEVICDDQVDAETIRFQLQEHMPKAAERVRLYEGTENIFDRYGANAQIEKSMARKVWLKSGGYLIIDENEALTAVDVNTGRFIGKKDQEKTSLRTNMEACETIAEQIRIRDIGGIIVIDFIDMLSRSHQEKVSEELKKHLRRDRAKTAVGRIGDFGLMMLTRKRQRMSLQNQMYEECPYCQGTGFVKQADEIFRTLKYDIKKVLETEKNLGGILITAHPKFVEAMTRRYRPFQEKVMKQFLCELIYRPNPEFHLEDFQITPLRRAEGEGLVSPERRIEEGARILPAMTATADLIPSVISRPKVEDDLADEDDLFDAEMEDDEEEDEQPGGALPAAAAPGEAGQEKGGRRRRRRRETSSERRARRRRLRELEAGGQLPAGEIQETVGHAAELLGEDPEPLSLDEDDDDEGVIALDIAPHFEPVQQDPDAVARLSSAEEDEDDEEEGEAEVGEQGEAKRRTRRGKRGGRARRKRQEEYLQRRQEGEGAPASAAAPAQPAAAAEPPQKLPPPRIKLTPRKTGTAAILANVLDEIERVVETLKTSSDVPPPIVPEEVKVSTEPAALLHALEPKEEKKRSRGRRGGRGGSPRRPASDEVGPDLFDDDEEEVKEVEAVLTEEPEPETRLARPKRPRRGSSGERKKETPPAKKQPAAAPAKKAEKKPAATARGRKPAPAPAKKEVKKVEKKEEKKVTAKQPTRRKKDPEPKSAGRTPRTKKETKK